MVLNDALDQIDLIDLFRIFSPSAPKCIFFSSTHGTFLKFKPYIETSKPPGKPRNHNGNQLNGD